MEDVIKCQEARGDHTPIQKVKKTIKINLKSSEYMKWTGITEKNTYTQQNEEKKIFLLTKIINIVKWDDFWIGFEYA